MELDSVIVGHATIDSNVLSHGIIENMLGGAPTYAGLTMTSLGDEVGVVSKIGQDFPEHFPPLFSKFGLNTEGILATSGKTTKFENVYTEGEERKQLCKEVADSISPSDIPQSYLNSQSFYISPVLNEITPETIAKLSGRDSLVMLDPQGAFREVDSEDEVNLAKPKNLGDYVGEADIVKVGKDELRTFDQEEDQVLKSLVEMGPEIAILTLGGQGCKVLSDGEIVEIESLDVKVEDLTGAGDVFGAAFLSEYLDTKDPVRSAKFATAAAGLKIEYKGPTGFPSREEVREAEKNL